MVCGFKAECRERSWKHSSKCCSSSRLASEGGQRLEADEKTPVNTASRQRRRAGTCLTRNLYYAQHSLMRKHPLGGLITITTITITKINNSGLQYLSITHHARSISTGVSNKTKFLFKTHNSVDVMA